MRRKWRPGEGLARESEEDPREGVRKGVLRRESSTICQRSRGWDCKLATEFDKKRLLVTLWSTGVSRVSAFD